MKTDVHSRPNDHSGPFPGKPGSEEMMQDCRQYGRVIESVIELRKCVGDGMNDIEFTHLLQRRAGEGTGGFEILCFSDGCLTFSVPEQDLARWYAEKARIAPAKEEIARAVAEKYGLSLCEPPDKVSYLAVAPQAHHHLELSTQWETAVVAHPSYLKIRLFSTQSSSRIMWSPKTSLPLAADLMCDLVELYR